jgi:hypothetical protein
LQENAQRLCLLAEARRSKKSEPACGGLRQEAFSQDEIGLGNLALIEANRRATGGERWNDASF